MSGSDDRAPKSSPDELAQISGAAEGCGKDRPRWYVIRCKPRYEGICVDELERTGFEALCPMGMEYRWRRRRQEAVPLFPGYVFSRLIYPDEIMRFFIETMNEDGIIKTDPELLPGDRVEFLAESMRGLVGTVQRIDSAEKRVHVLMDLLYQATIEVESYQVQAI